MIIFKPNAKENYVLAGEFEAYLALEKELAHTKDTNARIQLMTALKLQQRRMVENWKKPRTRPKVFSS